MGSTVDLERRLAQHATGEGVKYTRRRRPVALVYVEEYSRIDEAFAREKQVQNWSRAKRVALIDGQIGQLRIASRKLWRRWSGSRYARWRSLLDQRT